MQPTSASEQRMIIIYYFGHFLTCIMHAVHLAVLFTLQSLSLCSTLFLSPFHSTLGAGGARVMHLHNIAAVTVNIDLTDLYSNKGEFERETTRYRLHCRYICHSPSATHRVLLTEFY